MRNLISIFVILLTSVSVLAQTNMIIRKTDGSIYSVPISEVDSIYYEESSTFICGDDIIDYDGNVYQTVDIGGQCWMAENLMVSHEPDGTEIPLVDDGITWMDLEDNDTDKAYCWYDDDSTTNAGIYGALYTHSAANNACPIGWHLPSDEEFKTMEIYIGMSQEEADAMFWRGNVAPILKATSGWNDNGNGTDDYGFAYLPNGSRLSVSGEFGDLGSFGNLWTSEYSSEEVWFRYLGSPYDAIMRYYAGKSNGFAVRCVKD